jgi:cell wall-associated protease
MIFRLPLIALVFVFFIGNGVSQNTTADYPVDWFNLDPNKGQFNGLGTNTAYETLLKGRKSVPVIVAVIDSGVDIEHDDLDDKIWTNPNEIPNNGIDDDKNGYVDDIHGWNFIGNKNGKNVLEDSYELTRDYAAAKKYFANKDITKLSKKDTKKYEAMIGLKKTIDSKRLAAQKNIDEANDKLESIATILEMMEGELEGKPISKENLAAISKQDPIVQAGKDLLSQILNYYPTVSNLDQVLKIVVDEFKPLIEKSQNELDYGYNPDENVRALVGDNYEDLYQKGYGNNDVKGPDASHGTHVAGIIAAERGNGLGIDGIADNVRIMSLRAVPDGDERDKDIANAIKYAVDNGAKVINMSFGKGSSPQKAVIDEAVKYAQKKDVLLVHASGNSGMNNDEGNNFPTKYFIKKGWFSCKKAKNWLEVGAITPFKDENLVANFSNYGKKSLDIFSPGYQINSTLPNQSYGIYDGTSMASPMTAGTAALLRSYFPSLTAKQVKKIIVSSSNKINQKVRKPGSEDNMVTLDEISNSGGILNVVNAIKLASETKGKNKYKIPQSGDIFP